MIKLIFRCNSNPEEGLGHFIRCFNLACGIKSINPEARIIFDGNFCSFSSGKINRAGFEYLNHSELSLTYSQSMLIFDSYKHNQEFINDITGLAKYTVKIDDFNKYDLSRVDCVVNFRAGSEREKYNSKKCLLGLKYFPAPLSLVELRKKNINKYFLKEKKDISKIVIFIGGTDFNNTGAKLIKHLDEIVSEKTLLYAKRDNKKLKQKILRNKLQLVPLQEDISLILLDADCVICGGGLMKYDAGFSLIPNASLSQTSDQNIDSEISHSFGLTHNIGFSQNLFGNSSRTINLIKSFLEKENQFKIKQNLLMKYHTDSLTNLSNEILNYF